MDEVKSLDLEIDKRLNEIRHLKKQKRVILRPQCREWECSNYKVHYITGGDYERNTYNYTGCDFYWEKCEFKQREFK